MSKEGKIEGKGNDGGFMKAKNCFLECKGTE